MPRGPVNDHQQLRMLGSEISAFNAAVTGYHDAAC
jgi:hypothetical protein